MAKSVDGGIDRIESAADITLQVSQGASSVPESGDGTSEDEAEAGMIEVPISRLDTTKDVEVNEIRENTLKASGYSITSISYSGTMMFKGSKLTKTIDSDTTIHLDDLLYDGDGVPTPVSVTITHDFQEEYEFYKHVLVTSDSYEVRSEETTETAFDFVAMDKDTSTPDN